MSIDTTERGASQMEPSPLTQIPKSKYTVGDRVHFTLLDRLHIGTINQVCWEQQFDGTYLMVYSFIDVVHSFVDNAPDICRSARMISEQYIFGLKL